MMVRHPSPGIRQQQRGQMMMILALMATVIFGGVALAVDLGVQTHHRRSLQNASDMAALAAARDVPSQGDLSVAQKNAADDAVKSLSLQGIWPGGGGTPANNGCGGRSIAGYCFTRTFAGTGGTFTVAFSTPPLTPRNVTTAAATTYEAADYAEVDLTQVADNAFGSFVGQARGTTTSHSVAYHWGPGGSFPFALYSQTLVATGNQAEDVQGDVYVGTTYAPQSNGKAALCADVVPGSSPSVGGHIVFGYPQPPVAGGTTPLVNYSAQPNCPYQGNSLNAMAKSGECPGAGSGWDQVTQLCVANPPIQPPKFPQPAPTGQSPTPAGCTMTPSTPTGVYEVRAGGGCGGTVTLDFTKGDINCISLVLDAGSTVILSGAPKNTPQQVVVPVTMRSYGDPTCLGKGPGAGDPANRSILWAAPGAAVTLKDDGATGCCRTYDLVGSVDMPNGTVVIATNAALEIVGQTVVGTWNVQSGNHPNPLVKYAPSTDQPVPEVLRLVE